MYVRVWKGGGRLDRRDGHFWSFIKIVILTSYTNYNDMKPFVV